MLTIGGGILMLSHLHKKRGLQEGHKRHVPVLSVASVIIGSTELVTSYGFCGLAYWQGQHAIAYTSLRVPKGFCCLDSARPGWGARSPKGGKSSSKAKPPKPGVRSSNFGAATSWAKIAAEGTTRLIRLA